MSFHHLRAPQPAASPPAARQPGPVTRALRAMRQAVTTPPASGPVVDAIRTMRAADPEFDLNPDLIALRRALADRIEADIAALDVLGGDPDLEDGGDAEPSLCGVGTHPGGGNLWPRLPQEGGPASASPYDREGDDSDDEPSLGSLGGTAAGCTFAAQTSWAGGASDDREQDVADEPHDAEEDDDRDSGCADAEGALEAFGGHTGHFAAYA